MKLTLPVKTRLWCQGLKNDFIIRKTEIVVIVSVAY